MFRIVRSASLAAWATAHVQGHVGASSAVTAVTGDDEPHQVRVTADEDLVLPGRQPVNLTDLLAALRNLPVHRLRLVLPVPGDAQGLPGPTRFNHEALRAEEALVAESESGLPLLGLVPQVTTFGSRWEPGALVTWTLYPVDVVMAVPVGIAEADRELRKAILDAESALSGLDLIDLDDDAAAALSALREDSGMPAAALPPRAVPRSVHVLAAASRMRLLVDLALRQGRGSQSADTLAEGRRAEALRRLDTVARHAMVTAINEAVPTRSATSR